MSFINQSSSFEVLKASAMAAERAYIGCILLGGSTLELNDIRISPDEIYDPIMGHILKAIKSIYDSGAVPDIITVRQYLIDNNLFTPITTINDNLLNDLVTGTFMYHNLRKYESMVKENALKLATQKIVDKIMADPERSAGNILQYGQELIGVASNGMGNGARGFDISHVHKLADKIAEVGGNELYGFSFGPEFKFLDSNTNGIQKGKTYRIGAPSNTGKSQMVYSIINNLIAQGARVMFFTLENEIETTLGYLMSNYQGDGMGNIMRGVASPDFDYLTSISDKLSIIDSAYYLNDIFTKVIEFKPDVVILDYIGLMSIKGFTEEAKYTEYAIQVQRFVKQTKVSWIDLSNLPTNLQTADDIKMNPQFYGSTFLKNNTDVGMHIVPWKQFYEMRDIVLANDLYDDKTKDVIKSLSGITINLSKNRLGPHSVSGNFIINFSKGAKFAQMKQEEFAKLSANYGI